MNVWKPTAAEVRKIRAFAAKECRMRPLAVLLEPGLRCNVNDGNIDPSMNIMLVSRNVKDLDWFSDTDLHDYGRWDKFVADGVPLAKGGVAVVDFYCYDRRSERELQSNIQVYVVGGKLVALRGTDLPREMVR